MNIPCPISRRTFIRGAAGTAIALPMLEAMGAGTESEPPCRTVAICVRLGRNMMTWTPEKEGRDFALPESLSPLAGLREHFSVLSGLSHPDVWGSHFVETGCFLTAANAMGTPGYTFKNTQSMDQFAADRVGHQTRFPSLELITNSGKKAFLAWNREGLPLPPESKASAVFERLFVEDTAEARKNRHARIDKRKSILDFAMDDYNRLHGKVGRSDRRILDQYVTSVREVERRLTREAEWLQEPKPKVSIERPQKDPEGQGADRGAHMRAMFDLMTLAFQTDSTRIVTYAVNESSQPLTEAGVTENHHGLTHRGGPNAPDEVNQQLTRIDQYHLDQFAYFIRKLKDTPDVGGTNLLRNSVLLYGSGMSDAGAHSLKNLPILVAGHGRGKLAQGQHRRYAEGTPLCNLFVSMLQLMDLPVDSFADSTGPLKDLS